MDRRTSVWLTVRRCGWRKRKRFWSTLLEFSPWWILSLSKRSSRPPFHTWWNAYPRTMPYRYWCFFVHCRIELAFFFCKMYWPLIWHGCPILQQIVANSFLANLTTSALFATILVEYLLERLPEMGSNVELSNLYLKLFKLVFGSVSLFAAENEQMLKVSIVSYAHESF